LLARNEGYKEALVANIKSILALVGLGVVGRQMMVRLNEADLHGQVALITGSSRGLGLLIAREFAREGCQIVICARDEAELARAQGELEQHGASVLAIPCDVSDQQQVEAMIREVTNRLGWIDILVNNAGVIQVGPVETQRVEDFQHAMDVMYWGTVYPTLAVLPQMRQRKQGRIVNVTSIGGKISVPHMLPYSGAKFAATAFSEGLRAELAQTGITVTTIIPGLMRTGSYLNALFKGDQEGEFTWFSIGDNLPIMSIDAEVAAREIVEATKRGEAERILTLPANIAARVYNLFPGLSSTLAGLVNRFILPSTPTTRPDMSRGEDVDKRQQSPVVDGLTGWGRSAARRFNEVSEQEPLEGKSRTE
jgi:short-subunit dehydrogenase